MISYIEIQCKIFWMCSTDANIYEMRKHEGTDIIIIKQNTNKKGKRKLKKYK